MSLLDPFKLEKLKIVAYSDRKRKTADLVDTFEAMFNPTTLNQDYEVSYERSEPVGAAGTEARFTLNKPRQLVIELLLDGTGVESMGLLAPFQETVSERIDKFLAIAYHVNSDSHQPNFLVVEWGDGLAFSCRLKKVSIAYSSFDRAGNPLRAKLTVTFVSDATAETIAKQQDLRSPDVTHMRVVKAGDTLPLLTKDVYGSQDHYLFVAAYNELDDFRNLVPGRQLVFPPVVT